MPMNIPTMFLLKAAISKDFEQAEQLGLLEVIGEDFALPAFVCPSKIEMPAIIDQTLKEYYKLIAFN
jgi:Na+-transporting NADH:ubiquinone oxidoreductase subunit A